MKEQCIYIEKCAQTFLLDAFLLSLLSRDNSTIKPFSSSFLKRLYRSFEATTLSFSLHISLNRQQQVFSTTKTRHLVVLQVFPFGALVIIIPQLLLATKVSGFSTSSTSFLSGKKKILHLHFHKLINRTAEGSLEVTWLKPIIC